jgi:hypothetical protein
MWGSELNWSKEMIFKSSTLGGRGRKDPMDKAVKEYL